MALAKNDWIRKAIGKKGSLHKALGVPLDQRIPEGKLKAAEAKGGKIGRQAQLAETLKGLRKKKSS